MSGQPDGEAALFAGLRSGDEAAVGEFCRRYGPLIERLAERRLAGAMRRRIGPEDVAQSVCRTFVRRAAKGEFEIADGGALWGLLCAIALTKIKEQARFHLRHKRSLHGEQHLDSVDGTGDRRHPESADAGPAPDDAAEVADVFDRLVAGFDEEERRIIELRLQDFTLEEIAVRMECSERTVRRFMKRVQERLAGMLDTTAEAD
jgi:RNA polymerase sigma factor (sigma-70 family)